MSYKKQHEKFKFNLGQEVCTKKKVNIRLEKHFGKLPIYWGKVIERADSLNGPNKYKISRDKSNTGKVFNEDELIFFCDIGNDQ